MPSAQTRVMEGTGQVAVKGLELVVTPEQLQLAPGTQALLTLLVTNRGRTVDRFSLRCTGIDPAWFAVPVGEVNLLPDATEALQIELHVPDEPNLAAGRYPVRLTVFSQADPSTSVDFELPLEISTIGTVELELRPTHVSSRGPGHYVVLLRNMSNATQALDLRATDPDAGLTLELAAEGVMLEPGDSREVGVTATPRQRPLIGRARSYPFRVIATPGGEVGEQLEPIGGVDGVLTHTPPLSFLEFVPLRLRRWALLLLVLLLLAALLIWFLAGPGARTFGLQAAPTPVPTLVAVVPVAPPPAPAPPPPTAAPEVKPTAAPKPPPPTIARFEVVAPQQAGPSDYRIVWEVTGADQVKLGGQVRENRGSQIITSVNDAEYELEATGAGGTVRKSIGILVLRPPEVERFEAQPGRVANGGTVTLIWSVRGAQRASVDQQPDPSPRSVDARAGRLEVRPETTTTYTLTVENELGRASRSVEVQVGEP
jgi:hypothetical protein